MFGSSKYYSYLCNIKNKETYIATTKLNRKENKLCRQVRQLINERGNAAANQFVINTSKADYFQSYNSVIARIDDNNKLTLSEDWDYSKTTMKHLAIFLRHYSKWQDYDSSKAIRKGIERGEIEVVESLNVD